jgi:hypothetical protein
MINNNRFVRALAGHLLLGLLVAVAVLATPAVSQAQIGVGISVRVGPPALPVYEQPVCPGPGYLWTPGYWAWGGPDGYYWVPGTWVVAPEPGLLWTPGYWGWGGGLYLWHGGYWGPHVGFYGGINYGFGYGGVGYAGGYWNHGVFLYNRSVTNVNVAVIHNTYVRNVEVNRTVSHVSFNGPGGIQARPSREEMVADHDHHFAATSVQVQHENGASRNRAQWASQNHGHPAFGATARPGEFSRPNRPFTPPNNNNHGDSHPGTQSHPQAHTFTPPANNNGNGNQPHGNSSPAQHQNESHGNGGSHPSNGGGEHHDEHHDDHH